MDDSPPEKIEYVFDTDKFMAKTALYATYRILSVATLLRLLTGEWLFSRPRLHRWLLFVCTIAFVSNVTERDWVTAGVNLITVTFGGALYISRHTHKAKRKNRTGDTDNPFYDEYWRDDTPVPKTEPGYFETTR